MSAKSLLFQGQGHIHFLFAKHKRFDHSCVFSLTLHYIWVHHKFVQFDTKIYKQDETTSSQLCLSSVDVIWISIKYRPQGVSESPDSFL